jgi:hypothetical protein
MQNARQLRIIAVSIAALLLPARRRNRVHQSVIALTQKSKDLHGVPADGNRPVISDSY